MGDTTQPAAKAGKAKAGEAPELPSLDTVATALFGDERFKDLMGELVRSCMPSAGEVAREAVVLIAGDAGGKAIADAVAVVLAADGEFIAKVADAAVAYDGFKAAVGDTVREIPIVTDVLAAEGFADGVAQIVTTRVQSDDFPATIKPAIDGYLNANLPELVAAAMPETPEKAAARQAKAAARAQDERERADRKAAREREEAAEAERAERDERKAFSREKRGSLVSGEGRNLEPVDLGAVKRGTLFVDDGDHLSIDFAREISAGELEAGDGNAVLLKAPPITLGEGMPEPFTIVAAVLVLEMETGHRVLKCPMLFPLPVGGGATAQFGENALSFRPI